VRPNSPVHSKFEFQRQFNPINPDEMMNALEQEVEGEQFKSTDESFDQKSFFPFSVR
jgi:hypothetical protein